MHKIEIPDSKISIEFPSEIDEMTGAQFVRYVDFVLQYIEGKIDETKFKLLLTTSLLDIRKGIRYAFMSTEEKEACDVNLVRISDLMAGFIEDNPQENKREFKLKSVKNFVPRILHYFGPANCFQNMTYCEYRMARSFFKGYAQNGNEDDLNHMIAILYRPSKSFWPVRKYLASCDGERRIVFKAQSNPIYFKRRVKRIATVPFHVRYAVFLYFSACEDYLKTGRPVVDGNELDFSRLYTNDSPDEGKSDVGLVGLLYSLTETGVFGNIEQTDNTNIWDIMIRLYQVVMQMQEIEDKNKKS